MDVATAKTKQMTPGPDGLLLKEVRTKHGLSQEDMGLLLGLHQTAITHQEVGRRQRLSKLARRECVELLGLTTDTVKRRLRELRASAAEASA